MAKIIEISWAKDAAAVGQALIEEHHPHLADDGRVRFVYLFTTQTRKHHGKELLASTRAMGPVDLFFLTGGEPLDTGQPATDLPHFLVLISLVPWSLLSEEQRAALIDHELCHVVFDFEREAFVLAGHDLEEFSAVIERHGLWSREVRAFAKAAAVQLDLFRVGVPE